MRKENNMNILATFRSKNQAMLFANILGKRGVLCRVINTPRFLTVSCGLSVQFDVKYLSLIKEILKTTSFDTLGGLYLINRNGTFDKINI